MRIALAGNPNSGKTTLFNAFTGSRARIGNYPGVTVESRHGTSHMPDGTPYTLVDLPGSHSLTAQSPEEDVANRILSGDLEERPDAIVCVVDGTQLNRGLYLVMQLLALKRPLVIALNMMDAVRANGIRIDIAQLATRLGVTVVPICARRGEGIAELQNALSIVVHEQGRSQGVAPTRTRAVREPPLQAIDHNLIDARYQTIDRILADVVSITRQEKSMTERIDHVLLHPVGGLALFVLVMILLFQAVFSWSGPMIGAIETGMGWFINLANASIPPSLTRELLVNGILAGVGNVIVFLPQIAMLFFGMAVLEGSGYLARSAFLMDGLMRRVGLQGKAFVPLLSSFACAIPGIMAARTIESKRDRLVTIFIAPFMSCSARLPVYLLIIAALFSHMPPVLGIFSVGGLLIAAMYFLGFFTAIAVAWVLKKTALKAAPQAFILELPAYRMPNLKTVLQSVLERCRIFVTQTGRVIVALSVILWALMAFPRLDAAEVARLGEARASQIQLEQSFAGEIGHAIEPVIKPLGFDWRIGIALVASFAAREVLVSALGQIYAVGGQEQGSLVKALRSDIDPVTGKPAFTPLVGISLMVFFVLAMQCLSTVATVRRETGGWRWPIAQILTMNALAYMASFLVYQAGLPH